MCACFTSFYRSLVSIGNFLQPFFLLAIRLFWGWYFFKAGLDKFGDIHSVAGFFEKIGIPFSLLSAYLAAGIELVGGLLLILGLASRLAAIPLIITMIVALITAYSEKFPLLLDDPIKIVELSPFTFLMASATIFIFGPGPYSIDAAIKRWKCS